MTEAVKPPKTARTPEEKAARDARKAAKKAGTAVAAESNEAGPSNSAPPIDKQPKGVNAEDYEIDLAAPEPLSKAELRAAKRAAKRGDAPAAEGEKPKKRKRLPEYDPHEADKDEEVKGAKASGGAAQEFKKQNSVWIGNLAFKTTPESLKEWVEKGVKAAGGAPGCVTRVNLPKKPGKGGYGESKGFAYVDLVTPEMQKLAVGLSEGMLDGRKLLIKLGNDHTASEAARTPKPAKSLLTNPILRNQPNPEGPTLFCGNLPFDATEEKLRDLFEANAAAIQSAEAKDEATEEKKAAKRERWLKKQEEAKLKADEDAPPVDDDEDDSEAEGGEAGEAEEELDEETKAEQAHRGGRKSGLRKVRLGAFEDTGRCKGFAFLDFLDPKYATAALSNKKNHYYQNRKLILQYASETATKRAGGKGSRPVRAAGADDYNGAPKRPRQSYDRKDRDEAGDGAEVAASEYLPKDASAIARDVLKSYGGGGGDGEGYGGYEGGRGEGKKREDVRGKRWQTTGRPAPGAALAMAKREKVGIVPGEGKKISFD